MTRQTTPTNCTTILFQAASPLQSSLESALKKNICKENKIINQFTPLYPFEGDNLNELNELNQSYLKKLAM
jgi:hypothetical protein